jgi:outer membrane receptor for ferrienterochelin and colicin
LKKSFYKNIFTITAAGRYDDHSNFEGRFTPRVTLTTRVAKNNYLRFSYQTAYRFPSNQDQYIFLNTGTAYLAPYDIGFLDDALHILTNPIYTAESIDKARAALNPALLVKTLPAEVKPESVESYEIGYKGVVMQKLFIDFYAYRSSYTNFLGRVAVGQSKTGQPAGLLNPLTTTNISYVQNSPQEVKALGWGLGLEYTLPRNFVFYGNVYSDELRDLPEGYVAYFNAPHYRWNAGLRNENVYKNFGMNVVVKWQDNVYYEGTFATGTLPYFTWVDAQLSYKLPKTKSIFKLGGTNVGNQYARTGMGSPYVGGVYYLSYGYNL